MVDDHKKNVSPPAYIPHFPTCNFWLFFQMKKNLSGIRFEDIKKMKYAVTKGMNTFSLDDFHGDFTMWLERCVEVRESLL